MANSSYYFHTTIDVVVESKGSLRVRFGLVPPTSTEACHPEKLVWENQDGLGIYRVDFVSEPSMVIFRYWDQRYDPKRDGKPMEEAMRFFVDNFNYSKVTGTLLDKGELELKLD